MGGLLARAKSQPGAGVRSCRQLCDTGHCLHSSNLDPLTESKREGWKGQVSNTYIYSTLYIWLDGIKASCRLTIKLLLQSLCVILLWLINACKRNFNWICHNIVTLKLIFPWNKDGDAPHAGSHKNLHRNWICNINLSFNIIFPQSKINMPSK